MNRAVPAIAGLVAVALPATGLAAAEAKPKKVVQVTSKTVSGPVEEADRWGPLQVSVVIKTTTTKLGTKTLSKHQKIANVSVPTYPDHTGRSLYINQTALPYLDREALEAQSANVQMISGVTYSSEAFASSLQGALAQAAFKA